MMPVNSQSMIPANTPVVGFGMPATREKTITPVQQAEPPKPCREFQREWQLNQRAIAEHRCLPCFLKGQSVAENRDASL